MKINNKKETRQISKNLIINLSAFFVQFATNFFVIPLIVGKVGTAAYGFIGLANDCVSYAAVVASIFNSVSGRFIANEYYKKNYEKANIYYNSVLVANIILSLGFLCIGSIFVINLERIYSISFEIVKDVKITFALVFVAYIVNLVTNVFSLSTFITNRMDIQGTRNVLRAIISIAITLIFFVFVSIKIYWISLGYVFAAIIIAICNMNLAKKLTPELKYNILLVKKYYVFELSNAGIWMALTSFSAVLLRGLDLTIANIFLGDYEMGLLSVARTMPNYMTNIIGTLAPLFTPVFILYYAKNNANSLEEQLIDSIKKMSRILLIPIAVYIVYSYDFFCLWQPSLSRNEQIIVASISVITIIQCFFEVSTATMGQISVVVNKLKTPVIVTFICAIISIILEITLLLFTELKLVAIVLPTTIVLSIRCIIFNPFYAKQCIGTKKSLLKIILKEWAGIPIYLLIGQLVSDIFLISSWYELIMSVFVSCVINYLLLFVTIKMRKDI